MLKHVQISPLRNRSDSVSLRSNTSSCASSICGSPEPVQQSDLQQQHHPRTPSRASSYSSLNEQLPQTTIKVYTSCLKIDIEYKTLGIQWDTTSKEVITQLLRRLKMRHRDPRLFYLSMEVSVRRAGVKTILVLDDDTRPAILQACHPKGESRFCLQLKPGGLIRVHTSALQPSSQYKSLVISEETTSDELLQLLLSCYNSMEPVEQFSIYEVCPGQEYQRKLHPDDIPLRAQSERMKRGETCHFLVRRNPNYTRRRQLLSSLNEVVQTYQQQQKHQQQQQQQQPSPSVSNKSFDANSTISSLDDTQSLLDVSIDSLTDDLQSLIARRSDDDDDDGDEDEDCGSSTSGSSDTSSEGSTTVRRTPSALSVVSLKKLTLTSTATSTSMALPTTMPTKTTTMTRLTKAASTMAIHDAVVCCKCHNNFKSCEFCHKNSTMIMSTAHQQQQQQKQQQQQSTLSIPKSLHGQLPAYSPVYNIREIRTATNSFSSLGNDKKLLDIHLNGQFDGSSFRLRPQSVFMARSTRMITDGNTNREQNTISNSNMNTNTNTNTITNSNNNSKNNSDMNGNFPSNIDRTVRASLAIGEAVNNNPSMGLGHYVYL